MAKICSLCLGDALRVAGDRGGAAAVIAEALAIARRLMTTGRSLSGTSIAARHKRGYGDAASASADYRTALEYARLIALDAGIASVASFAWGR
ncbi:MAG: hypothetical protein U0232_07850 [Thermomicrobiales bacterium]